MDPGLIAQFAREVGIAPEHLAREAHELLLLRGLLEQPVGDRLVFKGAMEHMKPKDLALVRRFLELDKPWFGIADLEKILGQRRPGLYVTLHRLVRYGVLTRLRRGLYQIALKAPDLARVANGLVYPSYLSFESALARHGILSQMPFALSFATSRRSRRLTLGDTAVEFHHLKPSLFFGYVPAHGLYVAEPEKALLDQLYLASRGRARLVVDALA